MKDKSCDQRAPDQSTFFVVPSQALPPQASVSLGPLSKLAQPVSSTELRRHVDALMRLWQGEPSCRQMRVAIASHRDAREGRRLPRASHS